MATDIEIRDLAISKAVEALQGKSISLAELAKILAPNEPQVAATLPAKLPLPARITVGEQEAIDRIPEVYGSIVPITRRELVPSELAALLEERQVLDQVLAVVARRKEDIRTSVLNHLDVEAENAGTVDGNTPRDKDGHYILAGEAVIPGTGLKYAWEVSQGSPDFSITEAALSRAEWLAVSEPVRVFSEHKAILSLKKNPGLLAKLAGLARPGKPKGAFNIRKVK